MTRSVPARLISISNVPTVFTNVAAGLALAMASAAPALAQETYKIGIVSFLSGQAAESFGIAQ